MGMEIGISSPYFCNTDFTEMLERIAPHFSVWEIIGEHKHFLPNIKNTVIEALSSYDIELQLHLPFSDINLASVIPRARKLALDLVMDSMLVGSDIGITSMTLHPGSLSSINWRSREWALDTSRSSMKKIYELAGETGVRINLENMPYGKWMLGHSLEELNYLSKGFEPENWGICYDIGHGFISGEGDNIMKHPRSITNIHAHDNCGQEDSHLVPGKGNIDFRKIADALAGTGCETVIFEANGLEEGIEGKKLLQMIF